MPSAQGEPSVQPVAVSQPFGPLNGVILQGPPSAQPVIFFSSKNHLLICIFLTDYFCIIVV
jgi:hypothetical protein